MKEWML